LLARTRPVRRPVEAPAASLDLFFTCPHVVATRYSLVCFFGSPGFPWPHSWQAFATVAMSVLVPELARGGIGEFGRLPRARAAPYRFSLHVFSAAPLYLLLSASVTQVLVFVAKTSSAYLSDASAAAPPLSRLASLACPSPPWFSPFSFCLLPTLALCLCCSSLFAFSWLLSSSLALPVLSPMSIRFAPALLASPRPDARRSRFARWWSTTGHALSPRSYLLTVTSSMAAFGPSLAPARPRCAAYLHADGFFAVTVITSTTFTSTRGSDIACCLARDALLRQPARP